MTSPSKPSEKQQKSALAMLFVGILLVITLAGVYSKITEPTKEEIVKQKALEDKAIIEAYYANVKAEALARKQAEERQVGNYFHGADDCKLSSTVETGGYIGNIYTCQGGNIIMTQNDKITGMGY